MRVIGQALAQTIDKVLMEDVGYSIDQLMELAGLSVAVCVHHLFPEGRILVFCGPGMFLSSWSAEC